MNDKITPVVIILLVIAAFLGGSLWMKYRYSSQASKAQQPEQANQPVQPSPPVFNAKKTDKPEVKFFIMSFCPYGNQAENGLKPVAELLGDKAVLEPWYIVSDAKKSCEQRCAGSVYDEARCQQLVDAKRVPDMDTCKKYFPYNDEDTCLAENCQALKAGEFASLHGDQEKNQDVREICVWQMGDVVKWWDFVDKVNQNCSANDADTCWEQQASSASLDTQAIKSCQANQGNQLLAAHEKIVNDYSVQGSPTVYINDVLYPGGRGRTPEDYKKAICDSFTTQPSECGTVLGTGAQAAPNPGSCN